MRCLQRLQYFGNRSEWSIPNERSNATAQNHSLSSNSQHCHNKEKFNLFCFALKKSCPCSSNVQFRKLQQINMAFRRVEVLFWLMNEENIDSNECQQQKQLKNILEDVAKRCIILIFLFCIYTSSLVKILYLLLIHSECFKLFTREYLDLFILTLSGSLSSPISSWPSREISTIIW